MGISYRTITENPMIKLAILFGVSLLIYQMFGGVVLIIILILYVLIMAGWELYSNGPIAYYAVSLTKKLLGERAYNKRTRQERAKNNGGKQNDIKLE